MRSAICGAHPRVASLTPAALCVPVPGPCDPEDLIDGIIFAANYLGSTQLLSDKTPSKNVRMMQAQEAVSRIKVRGCRGWVRLPEPSTVVSPVPHAYLVPSVGESGLGWCTCQQKKGVPESFWINAVYLGCSQWPVLRKSTYDPKLWKAGSMRNDVISSITSPARELYPWIFMHVTVSDLNTWCYRRGSDSASCF